MSRPRILLVDDSDSIRLSVRSYLEAGGLEVIEAGSCAEAGAQLQAAPPDAAIVDYRLPDGTALDLLPKLHDAPAIVLTAHGSIDLAVRAIKDGAEHFLTKPIELATLRVVLDRTLEGRRTQRRDAATRTTRRMRVDPFLGESAAIRRLEDDARAVVGSSSPILITGPTGSGKGVLAAWLHENGGRADEAFVDLNCAGLRPEFLESELFGHERGAFTGAHAAKPGLLDVANHGTLFLDEIGDVEIAVQPKLLKVVEERRFRRLGDVRDRSVDVRLVAATNHDLAALVRRNEFRSDLYYRISTLPLVVPSLRDRPEDIPVVATAVLEAVGREACRTEARLSERAIASLRAYAWPGNVRELRNVLERALLLARGGIIEPEHLRLGDPASPPAVDGPQEIVTLAENERRYLQQVLAAMGGRVEEAARALGVSRSALYERLRRHRLAPTRS